MSEIGAAGGAPASDAGNTGAPNTGGSPPAATGGVGDGGGSPPPPPSRPEYLEEKFWDPKTNSPKVEDLAKSYKEIQAKFSTRLDDFKRLGREEVEKERFAKRPEKPEGYKLEFTKENAEKFKGAVFDEKSPLAQWFREAAHANGFDQAQFSQGLEMYAAEMQRNMPNFDAEMKLLGENGPQRVQDVNLFLKANMSEESYRALAQVATRASVVTAIEELMGKTKDYRQGGTGQFQSGKAVPVLADLQNKMKDPRYYDPNKRDPAFVREIEEGFKQIDAARQAARR